MPSFDIHLYVHVVSDSRLDAIQAQLTTVIHNQESIMADVKSTVAQVEADLATIKAGIAGLNAKIQDLNNKLTEGQALSAADAQALSQLATDADTLAATFPTEPAPPAPPPGV